MLTRLRLWRNAVLEFLLFCWCAVKHVLSSVFYADYAAVVSFSISQGAIMATQGSLLGIAPGATATFTANPLDENGNPIALPDGVVPTWTSSDTTNGPVVAAADGLTATVTVPETAATGTGFTLFVSATLPSGATPAGSAVVPIDAVTPPPPPPISTVASFVITQN